MSKKIIIPPVKDETGSYLKQEPVLDRPDISVDDLLLRGLNNIDRLMKLISQEIVSGNPSRNIVMSLKDCMTMLHEWKEKEQDILESLPDDKLQEIANKDKGDDTHPGSS